MAEKPSEWILEAEKGYRELRAVERREKAMGIGIAIAVLIGVSIGFALIEKR